MSAMGRNRTLALARKLQPLEQSCITRIAADRVEEGVVLKEAKPWIRGAFGDADSYQYGQIYTQLGDADRAFAAFDKAVEVLRSLHPTITQRAASRCCWISSRQSVPPPICASHQTVNPSASSAATSGFSRARSSALYETNTSVAELAIPPPADLSVA